jgi:molybdate transport system substrate-binding protein
VEYLNYAYGFTAKSQICTVFNGVEQYEAGSFHHEYTFGVDYFNPIVLTGIKVARTRTAAQETELTDFVNFLTGVGTTTGTNTLLQHCYKLP